MPLYAEWLSNSVAPNSYEKILEIGAGTGTMSAILSSKGSVVAYEPAGTAFEVLANNFSGSNTVTVCSTLDELCDLGPFSLIVLVNVLEHIDADVAFLSTIQPLLATNGELVIFSPAHNVLYSRFDAAIGHVRRYTTRQMRRTLVTAGFKPVEIRYFNSLGAIMWLIVNRLFRVSSASGGSTKLYDRLVVPLSIALDRIPIRPFGHSVLARSTHGNHD